MSAIDVFTPIGATVNLAVTSGSASVARTLAGHLGGAEVRLANTGTTLCFVEFGASTVTATTSGSIPILPGTAEVFGVSPLATHVAALTAAGTTTLYVTTGRGA